MKLIRFHCKVSQSFNPTKNTPTPERKIHPKHQHTCRSVIPPSYCLFLLHISLSTRYERFYFHLDLFLVQFCNIRKHERRQHVYGWWTVCVGRRAAGFNIEYFKVSSSKWNEFKASTCGQKFANQISFLGRTSQAEIDVVSEGSPMAWNLFTICDRF